MSYCPGRRRKGGNRGVYLADRRTSPHLKRRTSLVLKKEEDTAVNNNYQVTPYPPFLEEGKKTQQSTRQKVNQGPICISHKRTDRPVHFNITGEISWVNK